MIARLEAENVRYGLIYMVTRENFNRIRDTYFELFADSNPSLFSMKYQPLFIPDDSPDNRKLRERFSLFNLTPDEWGEFERQVLEIVRFEKKSRGGVGTTNEVVYPFLENNHEYLVNLRDFYNHGRHFDKCDTAPIIVIGSDGLVRPCMFLFNRTIGNILSANRPSEVLEKLSEEEACRMRCAECFSEECIGALRPYHTA